MGSKLKILVTGLCLQGNKGGPAIALSLMKQLRKYLSNADFIFSVPSGKEFQYEIPWAMKYGIEIVEDFSTTDILPPYVFRNTYMKFQNIKQWLKKLSEVDLLLEMSAISYTGHPIGRVRSVLLGKRLRYFLITFLIRKPFFAWTQSYGPLSPGIVRFSAKLDLGRQPVIFCRGDDCLEEVRKLLPLKKAMSFPDVATILDYNREWGIEYISSYIQNVDFKKLITLSPSAEIYRRTKRQDGTNKHIDDMVNLCDYLTNEGYFVLLVPHTYRPKRHKPEICDYAVSQIILSKINKISNIAIVNEDLSPIDLKSIICTAYIHIGARYHSVVASLSSGVPTISLSWHPKYKDIMRIYGYEQYVYDEVNNSKLNDLFKLFDEVSKNRDEISEKLINCQEQIIASVEENTRLFIDMAKGTLYEL